MIKFFRRHWVLTSVVLILILVRAMLPYIAKHSINWFLANKLEDYTGEIADFDLSLYRGAYSIEGFTLFKKGSEGNPPFLSFDDLDISIAWRGVFHGQILGDITLTRPTLRFIDSNSENKRQYGQNSNDWTQIGQKLVPIRIEKLLVRDGEIYFRNEDLKIPLLLEVKSVFLEAKNINNMDRSDDALPSTLRLSGDIFSTPLMLKGAFNIGTKQPDFDLDLAMENFEMPKANPLLLAYGPVTFTTGKLSCYAEAAARAGNVHGYIKPVFQQIDVVANQERFFSVKHFGVEILTAVFNLVLRNGKTKDVITKVDFEGPLLEPKFKVNEAIAYTLENAFGKPKSKKIENSVSLPHKATRN